MSARRLGALAATAAALASVAAGTTFGEAIGLGFLIGVMWKLRP